VTQLDLGSRFVQWANAHRPIKAVVTIGSRANTLYAHDVFDEYSDWDFQVVTSNCMEMVTPAWAQQVFVATPLLYVNQVGRLGHARKASVVFSDGCIDVVIIPLWRLLLLRYIVQLGLHKYILTAKNAIRDLGSVLRTGFIINKGGPEWGKFFHAIAALANGRLNVDEIVGLGNSFVIDFLTAHAKLARGEYRAAQRWLHVNLGETNFKLLHQLALTNGEPTYADARRIEFTASPDMLTDVTIRALPEYDSLVLALERSAITCRSLMLKLVGKSWKWPDIELPLRRK
jgi:hypothetical protein